MTWIKYGWLLAGVAFVVVTTRCSRPVPVGPSTPVTKQAEALAAPANVAAAVVFEKGKVALAVKGPDGRVKSKGRYVPPEGRVEIVVQKPSTPTASISTRLVVRDKGLCFSPALYAGGAFGRDVSPAFGVGAKLVYLSRIGVDGGVVLSEDHPAVFVAVSLSQPWIFRNTSLWVGYDTFRRVSFGLKVQL